MSGSALAPRAAAGELRIGLLDLARIHQGRTSAETLQITRELARRADASGCSRYWLAEHHGAGVACASPEVLAGVLAETTSDIRIGVAGVLIRFQAPLKAAESFRLLATLYPGRIDLGIARGGVGPDVSDALLDGRQPEFDRSDFERKVEDLVRYACGGGAVPAPLAPASTPEVWALGKGRESALMAGRLGLCYSLSLFLKGAEDDGEVLDAYRSAFRPRLGLTAPRCNVAVGGLLAATPEAAERLASEHGSAFFIPYLAGDVRAWAQALADLRARYGVDELVYLDLCTRPEDRRETVHLLMEARALADGNAQPRVSAGRDDRGVSLGSAEATVAREVAEALRDVEPAVPTLAGGTAGLAVAFDRFEEAWPGIGFGERADRLLAGALRAVALERLEASLFSGLAGVAWAAAYRPHRAGERVLRFLDEQVDPLLLRYVSASPWRGHFELVKGLTGIGVYALERRNAWSGRVLLESVVRRLAEAASEAEPGLAWHTRADLLPSSQRDLCPTGYFNLGLAHGAPGPIALLGAACAHGVAEATARPLLEGAVEWFLAQDPGDSYRFSIDEGGVGDVTRTGWCYGDPGIAAALLVAARGAGRPDWEERALAIARRAATRDIAAARVCDASICHGAAGLAHVFGRMGAATGDPALGAAAEVWVERTLALRDHEHGIAGFPYFDPHEGENPVPRAEAGLLVGAAGVALALLSASAPGEATWDRFLLLSAPGLP